MTIGSGAFIPGFEEQLVGAEIGKEVEVNVTFPAEYHATDLAGKPAVFKCTVKSITEKQLPELDDEFASEVSVFDTLAEYREDVKKTLEMKKGDEAKRAKEDAVIDAIIADSAMEIPEAMIETQQRQIVEDFAQRLQMQGLSLEQYFQFTGLNPQMMLEQVKPQALNRIQSRLVLEAIVKAEGIVATEEEFDAEATKMAETYQMELDKVKETLGETGKKQVMQDIAIAKAVELVVAEAKEGAAKKATAKKTTKKAEAEGEEAPAKKTTAKKQAKKAEAEGEEAPAKKPAAKKTTKKAAEKTEE